MQKVSEVPDNATVRLIEIKGTVKQREVGEQAVITRLARLQEVRASPSMTCKPVVGRLWHTVSSEPRRAASSDP